MVPPESHLKPLIGYATWYLTHGDDRSVESVRERMRYEYPHAYPLRINEAIRHAQLNIAATVLAKSQGGKWRPKETR